MMRVFGTNCPRSGASIRPAGTALLSSLLLFAPFAPFVPPALAGTASAPPPDSVTYNLPEILVTASPILVPSPNIVREVAVADFEALNAHTVSEALSQSTGLSIQRGTSGDSHVTFRGFRHRDVLIMFDGIPIASVFEGTIDLNEVSIDNVAKIKMIKGAPSVIYGTNAMGGVIDIVPKEGSEALAPHALFEFGENGARNVRAAFGGRHESMKYFVSTNYEASDGFSVSDDYAPRANEDGGLRDNSDFARRNVFLHLKAASETFGATSLFLNSSNTDRGFAPQAGVDDPDFERLTDSKRLTLGLSNSLPFIPASVKLYYNGYESEEAEYTDATYSTVDEVSAGKDRAVGAILYSRFATRANNILLLNASAQHDTYENSSDPDAVLDVSVDTYTLAAEDEIAIRERLSIAAGGLVSRFEQGELNREITAVNGQLVLGYQVDDRLALHASGARRTRFPKLRELYRDRYGNPELEEQTALNYEAGVKISGPRGIRADATLFLNELDGLIDRADRRSPYENLDDVTFKGFEGSSQAQLSSRLFGRAGYTYLVADEELADGSTRQLRRIPKHAVNTELRIDLPRGIFLSLNGIYVAALHDLDPDGVHTRVPDYLVANAKAAATIKERVKAYVAVSNVTDDDYVNRLGYPREGRSVRAGVDLRL